MIGKWFDDGCPVENYHKHTAWSNFTQPDSATSLSDFIKTTKERGGKCLFSTEHGYQGEWLYVYNEAKAAGLKFVYGVEAYWVKDIDEVITEEYVDKKGETKTREKKDATNCHMVLIARTYTGIRKLNYIISIAQDEGYYYKPRIDLNLLFTLDPEDVYVTSACVAGWKYDDADDIWLRISKHFGDSFFFEYQANNTKEQKALNKRIYELSQTHGIKTIIGMDTHYLDDDDRIKRDNVLANRKIDYPEEYGWYMDYPTGLELYTRMINQQVLPEDEIIRALENCSIFVDGCDDIEIDTNFKIPIIPKYQGMTYDQRAEALHDLLIEKFKQDPVDDYYDEKVKAIEYEFGEVRDSGCVDYLLMNYEIVNLAVNKYGGQLTTTSRGSAASYFICKLLGFTTIDRFTAEVPMFPERFITKDRILASHQMPDIDLNLASQEPFVLASRELLGEHGCYPLLAVGKQGEKSGFKMYARVKGLNPDTANQITSKIDDYNEAIKQIDDEEDKKDVRIEDYIKDKEHLRLFNESKTYQNIIDNARCHACGHIVFNGDHKNTDIIGYGDVRYEFGLLRCRSESAGTYTIVANVEGGLLDLLGFVKNDYLIVDVVGIIYKLYHAIGREVPTTTELRKMVKGDDLTWRLYADGATCCLNQCERRSTTNKAMRYKPTEIKELAAFIAGIRPGFKSLVEGFLNRIEYTNGEQAIDELLEDSFHYMLYQEAVMRIFSYLGISMKDSYDTIKKISKKKLKGEALEHVESTLREHWQENIGNLDNFESVYKVVKDSARYSFNAPHALSMAFDSLYEAWMKAHYPAVFYEVTINHYMNKGNKDKVADLVREATGKFGFKIGEYKFGKSGEEYSVNEEDKTIYPSISSIKGIGANTASVFKQMAEDDIDNIVDLYIKCKDTKVNAATIKKLIMIQFFSQFGSTQKLLKCIDIVDAWKGTKWNGRKTIKKEESELPEKIIMRYATNKTPKGNISEKQYYVTDWIGLVKALCDQVEDKEFGAIQLAVNQFKVLNYCDLTFPELDWRYVLVMNLDTRYSPRFTGYCLQNGCVQDFKIHRRKPFKNKKCKISWKELELQDGDVIFIKDYSCEKKRQKLGDSWVDIPGTKEFWLDNYSLIYREEDLTK